MTEARSATFVFLAGIGDSEPLHWQRLWFQALPRAVWVQHGDWQCVCRDCWVSELDAALRPIVSKGEPIVLVAHSLGCLLAAEWLFEHPDASVVGAFLVAPPDVHGAAFPCSAAGFPPIARGGSRKLPCPTMVVASTTDRYATIEHARELSEYWGAVLVDVGDKGHINLASNLGEWSEGRVLVDRFVSGRVR